MHSVWHLFGLMYAVMFLSSLCNKMYCGKMETCRGSAMVLSDRARLISYRLSIITMSSSSAVWP